MQLLSWLLVALLSVSSAVGEAVDYTGYKVIKYEIENTAHEQFLSRYHRNSPFIFGEDYLHVGRPVTVAVPPQYVEYVQQQADVINMKSTVIYEDMQQIINEERATVNRRTPDNNFDFDVFNTYDSIVDQLSVFEATCPEGLVCELYSYGQSYEGNDLWMMKIGVPGGNPNAYWMHGITHAREWLSPATLLKVMERFWTGYNVDDEATFLLNNYDWYLSVVTNPDGYIFTHDEISGDRMWRKNRGVNEGSSCLGTDLNRNYDVVWGTEGISHNPCDYQLYCGDGPASEPEIQAIQNEILRVSSQQNLLATVDIHTFGQMILMPLSYSIDHDGRECAQATNHDDLTQVSNAFADAIQATFDTVWTRGSPCEILYTVSGGSTDWSIVEGGATYSFCPELRGEWFTTPTSNIELSYQEFWNGILAMVDEIAAIEGISAK